MSKVVQERMVYGFGGLLMFNPIFLCLNLDKVLNMQYFHILQGTLYTGLYDGRIVKLEGDKVIDVVQTGKQPCGMFFSYVYVSSAIKSSFELKISAEYNNDTFIQGSSEPGLLLFSGYSKLCLSKRDNKSGFIYVLVHQDTYIHPDLLNIFIHHDLFIYIEIFLSISRFIYIY